MDEEIKSVVTYLICRTFHASKEWVEGCVEFFKEEHTGQIYSKSDLLGFVTQQWMLADLREFGIGCLPPNLAAQMKVTLHGKYSLQAEMVCDISQPCYKQLQHIRNESTENIVITEKPTQSWEPKGTRMMQLHLCDGVQEVKAIEYQQLPLLDTPLTPGCKVLITGPVDCRRGVLLLKKQNLQLIGGEVDTLITPNATENILARILNLPENPDPYNSQINMNPNTSVPRPVPVPPTLLPAQVATSISGHQSQSEFPDDDEMLDLMMVDAHLSDLEQQYQHNRVSSIVRQQASNECEFEGELKDMDLDALEQQSLQELSVPRLIEYRSSRGPKVQIPPKLKQYHSPSPVPKVMHQNVVQNPQPPPMPKLMEQFFEEDDDFLLEMPMEELEMKECSVQNQQQISAKVSNPTSYMRAVSTKSNVSGSMQSKITNFLGNSKRKTIPVKFSDDGQSHIEGIIGSPSVINNKTTFVPTSRPNSTCMVELKEQQQSIRGLATLEQKINSVDIKCLSVNNSNPDRLLTVLTCGPSDSDTLVGEQKLQEICDDPVRPNSSRLMDPQPFIYLLQVIGANISNPVVYTVKAFVLTLTTYLSMKRNGWHLSAKLCDGSAILGVKFSSDVLEKFIGFSPTEMMAMKQDMAKNPLVKEKVKMALDHAQQQLISLNCLLDIQFLPEEEIPCVISMTDITAEHLTVLKYRQT